MIDLNSLWIGDELRIRSSGRVGRFVGINSEGKARIDSEGKVYLVAADNLELYQHKVDNFKKIDELLGLNPRQVSKKEVEPINSEIDLHIEVLAPHLILELPAMILNYQLSQCKLFLENSIGRKLAKVVIIHGKGEGVLKAEVFHLLKQYKEIIFTISVNDGGATEVWMQY